MSEDKIGFLFDLDGVLIDTETIYSEIWKDIENVYPTGVVDFPRVIKGTTLNDILDRYFGDSLIRPKVVEMLMDAQSKIQYRYCKGAKELLEELKRRGIPAELVTSSDDEKMEHLFGQLPELKGMFEGIIDGTMVSKSKPDPEGYLLGAKLIGVSPCKCAVFEDSLQGVKAGRSAGAYVIGVEGTLPAETIAPYCDLVVSDLDQIDLPELIRTLKSRV